MGIADDSVLDGSGGVSGTLSYVWGLFGVCYMQLHNNLVTQFMETHNVGSPLHLWIF